MSVRTYWFLKELHGMRPHSTDLRRIGEMECPNHSPKHPMMKRKAYELIMLAPITNYVQEIEGGNEKPESCFDYRS